MPTYSSWPWKFILSVQARKCPNCLHIKFLTSKCSLRPLQDRKTMRACLQQVLSKQILWTDCQEPCWGLSQKVKTKRRKNHRLRKTWNSFETWYLNLYCNKMIWANETMKTLLRTNVVHKKIIQAKVLRYLLPF